MASRTGGNEKYRYLFSAVRFMLQNLNAEQKAFLREIREKTYTDPRLAGFIDDLKLTLHTDSAALATFEELELSQK